MQRLYIILFAVVLGIGSLFLFWSPEPSKRKQRRALPKVEKAQVDAPEEKVEEPEEQEPEVAETAPLPAVDLGKEASTDETDLSFQQGYCEASADPLETEWLRNVRAMMIAGNPSEETLTSLAAEFETLDEPMPRELLAQSIVLRQLGRTEDANAVTGRFPEPPPADIRSLVNDAKLAYRAGQFSESVAKLRKHQAWTLGRVLYLPFLARVQLTDELTRDFASKRSDGFQVLYPSKAEGQDWSTWIDGVEAGLDDLGDFVEGELPSPLTIVVLQDRSELLATTCGKNWAGGIYDGVIKLFLNEDGSLPNIRTVQHELIHATLERNFPNRAPMWFEEGLAELFEHRAKPIEARFETLRTNRVYVPLTTLSDGFHLLEAGEEANAAYLQSRLLLLWIQQDNAELSLADALGLLKGPSLTREAFTNRVLGSDFSMETYFQFIQKLTESKEP